MTEDWGVPDWRDTGAYPKPDDLSDSLWRWEFLRRRDDYREDWLRYSAETYHRLMGQNPDGSLAQAVAPDHPYHPDHPDFVATMPGDEAWTKYRLPHLYHPRREAPTIWFRAASGEVLDLDQQPAASEVYYSFDLERPLADQLKAAKQWLEARQRGLLGELAGRKRNRSRWPAFLRALDAEAAGQTQAYIAREILGHTAPDEASIASQASETMRAIHDLQRNFPDT